MQPRTIELIAYPNVNLLDLSGPLEVFLAANMFSPPPVPYDISVVGMNDSPEVMPGLSLCVKILDKDAPPPDTLIVPGGAGVEKFCCSPIFHSHFIERINQAKRVVSVCSGAFALAAAGKLDNRVATTHWSLYDELECRYPLTAVKRGPIFLNDDNVWTSAGVTSGIDLALSMVEADLGHSLALQIARHLVVYLKRDGDQSQFSAILDLQSKSNDFSDLHIWVNDNLSADLSVSVLANYMTMSDRNFSRKYVEKTGRTPKKMVENFRMDAVRNLLVSSNNPLKAIAEACGLKNESTLIRQFVKIFGITPAAYRARFGYQD